MRSIFAKLTLIFMLCTSFAAAQLDPNSQINWAVWYGPYGTTSLVIAGSGAPSATCSATVNNGAFVTNAVGALYQCSHAVASTYQWNLLANSAGGTVSAGSTGELAYYTTTGTTVGPSAAITTDGNADLTIAAQSTANHDVTLTLTPHVTSTAHQGIDTINFGAMNVTENDGDSFDTGFWALNDGTINRFTANLYHVFSGGSTSINSVSTGSVNVNDAANSGTGGFIVYSGGATPSTVASIDNSGNAAVAGITVNGGTEITGQSSANSQVVTCPTGGTTTQVCDAAGNWISSTSGTVNDGAGTTTNNQFATSTTTTHLLQYTALTGYVYGNGTSTPTASINLKAPVTNGRQTIGPATGSDATIINAAIIAAGIGGTVDLTPGQLYVVNAQVLDSYNLQVFNFNGSCIETTYTGGPSLNMNGVSQTLNQPCLVPNAAIPYAAIEDTGWQLTINGGGVVNLSGNAPGYGQYWYHDVQIDTDENATLNAWNSQANVAIPGNPSLGAQSTLRCDSTYCGSAVYNPPSSSGILTINNSSLSVGCSGNGIDWETSNALYLHGVTIQSYNQYGLLVNDNGAGAHTVIGNGVYFSPTACPGTGGSALGNPMLNGAQATATIVAAPNVNISINGGHQIPTYGNGVTVVTCSTTPCTENFGYYEVIHNGNSFTAVTVPLSIGVTGAAVNASFAGSSATVVAPCDGVPGDTYDFLSVDQTATQSGPIFGSSNTYAITGKQGLTCSGSYLTFTDTGARSSYSWPSEPTYVPSQYSPAIGQNGWPGAGIILLGTGTVPSSYTGPCPYAGGILIPAYTGVIGATYVTCTNSTEDGYSGNINGNTPGLVNRRSGMNYETNAPSAIVTPSWYEYTSPGLKGLYNLGPNGSGWTWQGGPTDLITLIDSNPFKTLALPGNRPTWDTGDTAVGVDATSGGLAFRDPYSISAYINTVPDGASYYERQYSTAKYIYSPVNVWNTLNVSQIAGTPSIGTYGTSTAIGSLPANTTYYYVAQGFTVEGHTVLSNEVNITTGSGSVNGNYFYVSFPTGVTSYNWYKFTSTGAEVGPCNASPIPYVGGSAETQDLVAACAGSAPTNTNTMPAPGFTLNGGTAMTANQGTGTSIQHSTGSTTTGHLATFDSTGNTVDGGAVPAGTVTSFSAGNLSPLFTTSVATSTSTPALTFSLSSAAQNSVFAGPASRGSGAPSFQTAPTISAANMTSFPTFNQSTTGNAATATNISTNGTANQVWGMNSGASAQGWQTVSGGSCANALTMNNGGSGATSGSTFNCSTAVTLSYNSIGAAALAVANVFTANQQATGLTLNYVANVAAPTGVATNSGNSVPASTTNEASVTCIDISANTTLPATSANVTTTGGSSHIVWSFVLPTGCTTGYLWMKNTGSFAFYTTVSGTSYQQNAAYTTYTAAASYPAGGAYPTANTTGEAYLGGATATGTYGLINLPANSLPAQGICFTGSGTDCIYGGASQDMYISAANFDVIANLDINGNSIFTNANTVNWTTLTETGSSSVAALTFTGSNSLSGGTYSGIKIVDTHNQTSTAGTADLLINRVETAIGSGAQLLADFQVGRTSKFSVDHTGNANAVGITLAGGTEMTGNQGTGVKVQHSTGSPTSGDCAQFDSTGNTVDAGAGCFYWGPSFAYSGIPGANQLIGIYTPPADRTITVNASCTNFKAYEVTAGSGTDTYTLNLYPTNAFSGSPTAEATITFSSSSTVGAFSSCNGSTWNISAGTGITITNSGTAATGATVVVTLEGVHN